jgi:Fe-S cluster assembly iron-binding protein IscA
MAIEVTETAHEKIQSILEKRGADELRTVRVYTKGFG